MFEIEGTRSALNRWSKCQGAQNERKRLAFWKSRFGGMIAIMCRSRCRSKRKSCFLSPKGANDSTGEKHRMQPLMSCVISTLSLLYPPEFLFHRIGPT